MPIQILMPALSPTMEEGKLAKWLVKEGQKVRAGDILAEIETDKATMEVEAVDEGTLQQILIAAGTEKVKVNTPIAVLLADGEVAGATPVRQAAVPPVPAVAPPRPVASAAPPTQSAATVAPVLSRPATPPGAGATMASAGLAGVAGAPMATSETRLFASPLARRRARELGVDLAVVRGSGPHGRVIDRDVVAARSQPASGIASAAPAAATALAASATRATSAATGTAMTTASPGALQVAAMPDDKILALYDKSSYEVVSHDGMRRIIAQRLTQSKQTVPHFYMTVDCRLDSLLSARERINAAAPKEGPRAYKLSVNDFVIKALALALQQVPAANATWTEQGMLRHRHSDVGVAVAVEGGLFTPIVRHAELKTLGEISNEMKDLAGRARNRRLAPHEYQGGTTSISNLGMFGIKSFDAVINPPHATILAVGAGEKRAVVVGDALQVAT